MSKQLTSATLISKHVTRRDRVLLLNPPVEETRYSWLRWNQPLDLLKLGAFLKKEIRCSVSLLDCMKPDSLGMVRDEWLPRGRKHHIVHGERYPIRRYGMSYVDIGKWLDALKREKKEPTQVWMTSLCSYWYCGGVAATCRIIREHLPDAKVVLLGQAARLLPKQVAESVAADYVVTKVSHLDIPAAIDLYEEEMPQFLGLQIDEPKTAVAEITNAVSRNIMRFTFFHDDLCRDDGQAVAEIINSTKHLHRHIRFHFICGLDPSKVTPAFASIIADPQVAEAHFEETEDTEAYARLRRYVKEAGLSQLDNRLNGFVWIGRPREKLEEIIIRSFKVLNNLEGLILKPYSPTPGSPDHLEHEPYLSSLPPQNWSPHLFPFAELNGISREEYHDLYRMAAFLNEKVRDSAFDFLKGTLGAQMLKESLRKEVWKLEPSPLRVID